VDDIQKLTNSWIKMHLAKRDSEEYEREFWSFDLLWGYCGEKPDRAWAAIQAIYRERPEEIVLANLAAGPVEDLLVKNGAIALPWIDHFCSEEAEFVEVLQMVWRNAMTDEIWKGLNSLIAKYSRINPHRHS
jgi:hypothetical protein